MVLVRIRMMVRPSDRGPVLQVIGPLCGPTRAERGCLNCQVLADTDDENALTLIEEWDNQEDLDSHMQSDGFRDLLSVLDLATEPPQVSFDTITETRGMEVIQAARTFGNRT